MLLLRFAAYRPLSLLLALAIAAFASTLASACGGIDPSLGNLGACSATPCPIAETWDPLQCACVPVLDAGCGVVTAVCSPGYTYDPLTCRCVIPVSADAGSRTACPGLSCPAGTVADTACGCCPEAPPVHCVTPGYAWDPVPCACVPGPDAGSIAADATVAVDAAVACGGPGEACCLGNTCGGGGCCVNFTCVATGGTCPNGLGVCASGSCGTCGGVGQACCQEGTLAVCTAPGASCTSTKGGTCDACGVLGGPCCANDECLNPLALCGATTGICTDQCGQPGQPCCQGSTCGAGGCCVEDTAFTATCAAAPACSTCGLVGQPCCSGGTCGVGQGTCSGGTTPVCAFRAGP